jgi:hypothetical protein
MSNRILHIRCQSLLEQAGTSAEVHLEVTVARWTARTEIRGRLMGPTCAFAQTVEVAYPLRPLPAHPQDATTRSFRVIIPEASLWDLESPFLYHGPVELWQDGVRVDQFHLVHGLRTLRLGAGGVRLNGQPTLLSGEQRSSATPEELVALRQQGHHLLLASLAEAAENLWALADSLGFLLLGLLPDTSSPTLERVMDLDLHASALGWVIPCGQQPPDLPSLRFGLLVETHIPAQFAQSISFLVCPGELCSCLGSVADASGSDAGSVADASGSDAGSVADASGSDVGELGLPVFLLDSQTCPETAVPLSPNIPLLGRISSP